MADQGSTQSAKANVSTAPANGGAQEKKTNKKREAPVIVCAPTKAESDEIKGYVSKLVSGLPLDIPVGAFVLQHALKSMRAQYGGK